MSQLAFSEMFDSAEEATSAAIANGQKEFKEVACALYPSMKPQSAYARLKESLAKGDQKLSADDHIFIANFVQQFHYLHYAASRCHHSTPHPVAPQDELAELQRKFIAAAEALQRLAPRIEKAEGRLRAVS
jgi:hypothetical protein